MKIYLEHFGTVDARTGKQLFCNRLGRQLSAFGHMVTNNPQTDAHIALHNVRLKTARAKINVVRIDGVCFDTRLDYGKKNKRMAEGIRNADGIIYQSMWAKQMYERYVGRFKGPTTVILNGADPEFYRNIKPAEVGSIRLFLAAARWRAFKRLRDIIESFILAKVPNGALYVVGDTTRAGIYEQSYMHAPEIVFCGSIDEPSLASYLKRAMAFLHLSWFDACPNGVVEAVCAGLPVICGNVGGTKEIVEPSGGIVCQIEGTYNHEPVDVYNPPPIDRKLIVDAIWRCINEKDWRVIKNDHVDIRNVAHQYVKFFEDLLLGTR